MLPIAPIAPAPALDLTPQDIDTMIDALRAYHAIDRPLFQRREPQERSAPSLHGLLLNIPRQAMEPMGRTRKGAERNAGRAMPQCVSAGAWEDDALLPRHWPEVNADGGDDEGGLTLDGSDVPTQGTESVGVKRQSCGARGQRAHGQAGVCVGDVSQQGYTWLDRRLYLPEAWVTDGAYAARRQACGVPEGRGFTTTPMLGWAMIQAVMQAGTRRGRWGVGDEAVGRDTMWLDQRASLGLWYGAEVPHDPRVGPVRPVTAGPSWSGRGRKPTRARLGEGAPAPATVAAVAAAVATEAWSCQRLTAGSQGPWIAAGALQRVIAVRQGVPGPESWLVLRRTPAGALHASLCTAPADTAPTHLVRMSGMRWTIATCFETGKQSLGLGDDAVRSWRGWHHHMTLVSLALSCMVRLQGRWKKTLPP